MNVPNGYVEVLECRRCGFLGTIDLYLVDGNSPFCPECGNVYLAYAQARWVWYAERKRESSRKPGVLVSVGHGQWDWKEKGG